jgi:hypothetical protein
MSEPFIRSPKPVLVKTDNPFTVESLVEKIGQARTYFPDQRRGTNRRYSLKPIALSAFSRFFTPNASFLQFQKDMEKAKGKSYAPTLFQIEPIPSENPSRNLLDEISPELVYQIFTDRFDTLNEHPYLEDYRRINDDLLIAFDGTHYHRSQSICCQNSNIINHRNGTVTDFHQAIMPVVVVPGNNTVISWEPELITPPNGHDKQDCEPEAMKRWLLKHSTHYRPVGVTVRGDDLYGDQPRCLAIKAAGFNFMVVCWPPSHLTLYEWIDS